VQKFHALLKGVAIMSKLVRIVVQLPVELKEQLDALKQQGYTTSGFIRATLERELNTRSPRRDPVVRKAVNKRGCGL
jgi:metal-responsive CopG/Arc/MetJ family transcriptional regulator